MVVAVFEKANPPIKDPHAIASRDASFGSFTAFSRELKIVRTDSSAYLSEISLCFTFQYASIACTIASIPEVAVTSLGQSSVSPGSTIAISGNINSGELNEYFLSPHTTDHGVTSEPVP